MKRKYRVYDGRIGFRPRCQQRFVVYEVCDNGVKPLWSASSLEELELRAAAEGTSEDGFEREIWCVGDGEYVWKPSGEFLSFGGKTP